MAYGLYLFCYFHSGIAGVTIAFLHFSPSFLSSTFIKRNHSQTYINNFTRFQLQLCFSSIKFNPFCLTMSSSFNTHTWRKEILILLIVLDLQFYNWTLLPTVFTLCKSLVPMVFNLWQQCFFNECEGVFSHE